MYEIEPVCFKCFFVLHDHCMVTLLLMFCMNNVLVSVRKSMDVVVCEESAKSCLAFA